MKIKEFELATLGEEDEYQVYDEDDKYEVEQFKVDGIHFSHDHPLSLLIPSEEEDKLGDDDHHHFCKICGLPVFVSTPTYTCSKANNACKFFLHQQCALKLPPKLTNSTHCIDFFQRDHHLRIVKRPSTNCMTYKCQDCAIKIHPLVEVSGVEIKIKHNSHPSHEMVAVCKEISCHCDACGLTHQGFFFACQQCNFWIHQDCTTLPDIIMFAAHPHPFILAYSLSLSQLREDYCILCKKPQLFWRNGIYLCPQTKDFAHATCGLMKKIASKSRLELMQLPDDELNAFPALMIQRYAETMKLPISPNVPNVHGDNNHKFTIHKYHNHPLILTHQVSTTTTITKNLACDLCTRPINLIPIPIPTHHEISVSVSSPLFYKCVDDNCHFAAHRICADILPTDLNFIMPGLEYRARIYGDVRSYMFSSIFNCRFCHRPCNGLCYYFSKEDEDGGEQPNIPFFFDLECISAPATLKHASHAHHILYRTDRLFDITPLMTCCWDESLFYDVYRCITCEYLIHIRCAILPQRIIYREYHHHPLHLIFTTIGTGCDNHEYEGSSNCFCEVCEEDIDLKYWFYRCSECDQLFHINCIPAVGHLSKVKFGGTFSLPDGHSHPLKLKRMLTLHSQRCGDCKQIIQGLVDQMAFFCSRCQLWLHFSCAAAAHNKNTPYKLKFYSDFEDKAFNRIFREKLYIDE